MAPVPASIIGLLAVLGGIIFFLNRRANKAERRTQDLENKERVREYNAYRKERDVELERQEREYHDKKTKFVDYIGKRDGSSDDSEGGSRSGS